MSKNYRIASPQITHLVDNEVFVFGSNLAGRHGAGAAKLAFDKFGARYGVGIGLEGNTYAIPTKGFNIETLPLEEINKHVQNFLHFALWRTDKKFLVTEIGCGLAGYSVPDISPMFQSALDLPNVYLPQTFCDFYESNEQ